jgi:hypothetical protein
MALSNAEKQARWRAKRDALVRRHPDMVERTLLEEAARCEQLSAEQCHALADRLADIANPASVAFAQVSGDGAEGSAAGPAAGRAPPVMASSGAIPTSSATREAATLAKSRRPK